ncbi:hypothetical protein DY000_02061090 [Brassica cretica]|uniref:Uncharacterized protein n=1 Tax=Brassica cretica TaxID=69181 RepID=A0ABQ7B0Z2_BRACR|nr:hypothetical protein DY000_02061090 [Brassica cretica]
MQRSDGRSDTNASTTSKGAESATEKYILGNKLVEIHLGEGRSHGGSFLKGLGEALGNLPYLGRVRLEEQVEKGLDLVRVLFKEILDSCEARVRKDVHRVAIVRRILDEQSEVLSA